MGQVCGCVEVDESTVMLTKRFGKHDRMLQAGLHCVPWCLGYTVAGAPSLQLQQLDVRCDTKTKDDFFVTVAASVYYCVKEEQAADAFYYLTNAREVLQDCVSDLIKAKIPPMPLGSLFEQKREVAVAVGEELGEAMSTYGYKIIDTLIVEIELDATVMSALAKKQAAALLRVAANDKAEAEKIVQVKRAEGEVEAAHVLGLATARQRKDFVNAIGDNMLGLSEKLHAEINFSLDIQPIHSLSHI